MTDIFDEFSAADGSGSALAAAASLAGDGSAVASVVTSVGMTEAEQWAALLSVASISMLHTLLPNHWLGFSLVGKAQKWSLTKVLAVTFVAGCLHVASTLGVGYLLMTIGRTILREEDYESFTSGFLMFIGLIYLGMHCTGHHGHSHERVGKLAVFMLLLIPAISPCTAVLPVFMVVANESSRFIGLAALVFFLATVSVMLLLVALSYLGVSCSARFECVNHYEKLIVGLTLFALGALGGMLHSHDGEHAHDHAHGGGDPLLQPIDGSHLPPGVVIGDTAVGDTPTATHMDSAGVDRTADLLAGSLRGSGIH